MKMKEFAKPDNIKLVMKKDTPPTSASFNQSQKKAPFK